MIRAYDERDREHRIDVKKEREHYVVEVDGHFYCSCDSREEARAEIPAIMLVYGYHL
jgi:hypothetical protein